MKNKIISILVGISLIITAMPVLSAININNNQLNDENNCDYSDKESSDTDPPPCGTAYVILRGSNETAKIGAVVRFYAPIICNIIRNPNVFSDIDVVYQSDPYKPGYGKYCAIFDGCGCYQAVMLKNKGWCGANEPWVIIANDQNTIVYIDLIECKSRNLLQSSSLILSKILEKLIDHFPLLAMLL